MFDNDFTPIDDAPVTSKRSVEELFGDIDDILYESQGNAKRHKGDHSEELALIEHIIELRKLARERDGPDVMRKDYTTVSSRDKNNLSYAVPSYPFVGVTRDDGRRVYIRCHSEQFELEERARVVEAISLSGSLDTNKEMWAEAQALVERHTRPESPTAVNPICNDKELWVDLYKPRKYFELLSDESTNRLLLRWIKLWDKVVFKRRPKIKIVKPHESKKFKMPDLCTDLDEHGRPHHKVALLCGPPGLGKTTLAHMVARHAGYNVVEVNASDDRSIDAFKTMLENSTQMRSLVDAERRPNCIVFDEIDGAPASSIEYLVKFVTGTGVKTKKGQKEKNVLRRPVICICNDVYVAALRP
jgi:chromosome transmission fidelity protein 18